MAAFTYENYGSASPVAEQLQRFGLMVGNAALKIADKLSLAYQRHQTRRQLQALSDRQLEDIGLSRGDIEGFVARI